MFKLAFIVLTLASATAKHEAVASKASSSAAVMMPTEQVFSRITSRLFHMSSNIFQGLTVFRFRALALNSFSF